MQNEKTTSTKPVTSRPQPQKNSLNDETSSTGPSKAEPRARSRAELLAEYPDVACRLMAMAILDNHPELASRLGDKALNRMLKGDHGVLPDLMLTDPGAFQEHPLKRLSDLAHELVFSTAPSDA